MDRPELEPLRDHFPLRLGSVQIELVRDALADVGDSKPEDVWAPIRVIEFDHDGRIRDILEQPVRLASDPDSLADAERVGHCIAAHVEVLTELFGGPKQGG